MKWLLRICATFLFVTFLITVLFHMPRSDVRSELVSRRKHKVVELRDATVVKRSRKTNSEAAKRHDMAEVTQLEQASNSPLKTVVILTYQRCGSSFLGRLFNLDPRVFYVFEPLDGLYSSMYGTLPGWNVPSNIVTYKNGTERVLPSYEIEGVSTFLANLFHCDVSKLPTESLIHPFWKMFRGDMSSTNNYIKCMAGVVPAKRRCNWYIHGLCPSELGLDGPATDERCYRLLHHPKQTSGKSAANSKVYKYKRCMSQHRQRVDAKCSSMLKSACSSRSTRVVKLVRGTMETMRTFLRLLPETRVIHLVRDPRAVGLSRYQFLESGRGLFTRAARRKATQIVREAAIYCRQVVADVRWRQRLELEFPGQIHSLTYEQLVADPVTQASELYRFMGETDVPPEIASKFMSLADKGRKNITAVKLASRWQRTLTPDVQRQVKEQCEELMKLFPDYV